MASGQKRPQSVEFERPNSKRMTGDHIPLLPCIEELKCASQNEVHVSNSTAEVMDPTYTRALEGLSGDSYTEENEDSPEDQIEIMADNSSKVHDSMVDFVIKADGNHCLASNVFIIFAESEEDIMTSYVKLRNLEPRNYSVFSCIVPCQRSSLFIEREQFGSLARSIALDNLEEIERRISAADKVFLLGIEYGALSISSLLSKSLIPTNKIEAVAFFIGKSPVPAVSSEVSNTSEWFFLHSRVFVECRHGMWALPLAKRAKERYGVLIPSEEESFKRHIDEALAWMQKAFT